MNPAIHPLIEVPVGHGTGQPRPPAPGDNPLPAVPPGKHDMGEAVKSLQEVERDYIIEILSRSGGNRSQAARMLNISRRTLQRKMARFG